VSFDRNKCTVCGVWYVHLRGPLGCASSLSLAHSIARLPCLAPPQCALPMLCCCRNGIHHLPGASKSLGTSLDDHIISGRRFRWVETMLTWDAAQANCKKLGGTLATADTQAISDALVADYKKGISSWWLPSIGAWIGLRSAKGDFESCPWTWTWVANGKTPNVMADFSAFRSGSAVAGSPAGGCAVLKPAEQRWPYGFGEWLGYPCSSSSTLAASFCEL
jgi:hypothetical protein